MREWGGGEEVNLTIERVYPKAREFFGKNGPLAAVKVLFSDQSEGDFLTTPDKASEHVERLTALIGKSSEFELDAAREREYNGVLQRAIKNYPGRPQSGGGFGGGSRQFTPSYANTEEGVKYVQQATDRRTALMQAVAFWGKDDRTVEIGIMNLADDFYAWLRQSVSDAPKPPSGLNTPKPVQNASPQAQQSQNPYSDEWPDEEESQTEAMTHQKRFFALWNKLGMPDNGAYMRYVIRGILVKLGQWDSDRILTSRSELTDLDWGHARSALQSYSTNLVRNGVKPMDEQGFKKGAAA